MIKYESCTWMVYEYWWKWIYAWYDIIHMDKEVILYVIAIQFSCYVFLNAKCMDKSLPSLFMRSESMTTQIPICDLGRVGSNIHEYYRINEVVG